MPVLAGSLIRFRRSLRPFQSYTVETRFLCVDNAFLHLLHVVRSGPGLIYCIALDRMALVKDGKKVDLLASFPPSLGSPEELNTAALAALPESVADDADALLKALESQTSADAPPSVRLFAAADQLMAAAVKE